MTDFLTDLLQRSRGQATELAPRLPSIFEPAGGEAPSPAGEEPVWQPTAVGWAASAGPDDPALAPSPEQVQQDSGRIPAWSRDDGEIGRRPPDRPVTPGTEPDNELEPRLVVQTLLPRSEPVGSSLRSAGPHVAGVSLDGAGRALPSAVDAETMGRREPADRLHPLPSAAPQEHVGADRVLGFPRSDGPQPLDGPPPPRLGALSVPPRPGTLSVPPPPGTLSAPRGGDEAPSRVGGHSTPPPEPTVHVTIGRLEIRAVTAPLPPARRPPAARTMSLDEYLSERNRRRQA
jgi:hypothetical protein